MAITLLQRRKIQQALIPVLVFVLLVTTTVLWFGFFKKGGAPSEILDTVIPLLNPVEINFDVLENPVLQTLDNPPVLLEEPEFVGRINPFLPF